MKQYNPFKHFPPPHEVERNINKEKQHNLEEQLKNKNSNYNNDPKIKQIKHKYSLFLNNGICPYCNKSYLSKNIQKLNNSVSDNELFRNNILQTDTKYNVVLNSSELYRKWETLDNYIKSKYFETNNIDDVMKSWHIIDKKEYYSNWDKYNNYNDIYITDHTQCFPEKLQTTTIPKSFCTPDQIREKDTYNGHIISYQQIIEQIKINPIILSFINTIEKQSYNTNDYTYIHLKVNYPNNLIIQRMYNGLENFRNYLTNSNNTINMLKEIHEYLHTPIDDFIDLNYTPQNNTNNININRINELNGLFS
jgi:hypothetical protein